MPYCHQSYHFRCSDKFILLVISYPTLFISCKKSYITANQLYRFPKFLNEILPNRHDQNKIWRCVVANIQNAEMHVQFCASSHTGTENSKIGYFQWNRDQAGIPVDPCTMVLYTKCHNSYSGYSWSSVRKGSGNMIYIDFFWGHGQKIFKSK